MLARRAPRLGLMGLPQICRTRAFCATAEEAGQSPERKIEEGKEPAGKVERPWLDAEPLSLNQALYLTTEMGIYTTREMQLRVMKSPSFSTDTKAPFVVEDFFNSMDEGFKKQEEDFEVLHVPEEAQGTVEQEVDEEKVDTVNTVIHNKLVRAFTSNPRDTRSFIYNGQEWKERAEGRGLRKRATAHVVLQRGSGVIKVNGDEDFYVRFPLYYNRFDVVQPLLLCGVCGVYDVFIAVAGGGTSGQSGAIRLAIGRALLAANPACEEILEENCALFQDLRQTISKIPGHKGPRSRATRWHKR
ncbi:hypothetical protein FOZ62_022920 [Perkinsus olseni]|uniref:28S ribosomal protein S9, mitochondrial n=1 Tax=Perkinsus olseni TaxID=32597 RepID=A0A7J6R2E1_PEROL|nr:hypothetical protein FOZ62_022920 [Perkinsus olseni]